MGIILVDSEIKIAHVVQIYVTVGTRASLVRIYIYVRQPIMDVYCKPVMGLYCPFVFYVYSVAAIVIS